ncbi:hypothetical protein SAMN05660976_05648 [Nonomuraea pusilla]|uniref:Uncharacterized protein n=1 Tax=Nonomuraea pusilla TaxID=46177 RepID=A0A1H7ZW76_9ACTN|nr:hypothetical protein SAMN05660976_05648 [Nonomuraea pusilla]
MNVSAARRPLRIAAAAELASLVVLLGNLVTVHLPEISSLAGPVHGCAYLFTVVAAARDPRRTFASTALAWLPGIGGLLALRSLDRAARRDEQVPAG